MGGHGKDCAGSSTKTGQCNTNTCCVDTYPRKYRCKTSVPCSRLKRKCNKTLKQALSNKCEKKLSKADLRKKVKAYCKKTCNSCNSRNIDDDKINDGLFNNEVPVNSATYAWWYFNTTGEWPPSSLDSISMGVTTKSSYDPKTFAHGLP